MRRFIAHWLAAASVAAPAAAADLTPRETHWLRAGLPVLTDARQHGLPVDVVVQPQDAPGQAPLAMDFVDGRCKLVLSMRGNPLADAALAGVDPALEPLVIEAMTAHEVGHCWRHVRGRWKSMPPAGFGPSLPAAAGPPTSEAWEAMQATRREEAYADLAGLAWTLQRHPGRYAEVHAWFESVRRDPEVPGSHHDTRAWLQRARDPSSFPGEGSPYERAQALWSRQAEVARDRP